MQCANVLKKRSLEPDLESWSCSAKRVCLEAGCQIPMEMTRSSVTNQQQEQQVGAVRPRPAQLLCPRCLGGEPVRCVCVRNLGSWKQLLWTLTYDPNTPGPHQPHYGPVS